MIRIFRRSESYKSWDEVRIIDDCTGDFSLLTVDRNRNMPFGKGYKTTITTMGYKSVDECIRTLKQRKMLGTEIKNNIDNIIEKWYNIITKTKERRD